MFKWIGAILVFGAVLCSGTYPLLCKMNRLRALRELISSLERMRVDMRANVPTMPQLINDLLESAHGVSKLFFQGLRDAMDDRGAMSFYDEWKHLTQELLWMLSDAERAEMMTLGDMLGCYSAEDQIVAMERTISVLQAGALIIKKFIREKMKLYVGTSVSVGMIVVIVLL